MTASPAAPTTATNPTGTTTHVPGVVTPARTAATVTAVAATGLHGLTALQPLLEQVGLAYAAAVLPAWLDRAAREELPYPDFLQGLLEEEASARANATIQRRLREAGFPFAASIEQFDFRFRPELKRQVVLRYLDPTFVEQARSLALIGAPGLGKTMLAICIATKHVQLGYTARFVTAQQLANQLGRALTGVGRQRVLRPLLACDVLVLDELGYLPTQSSFGPALYELVAPSYPYCVVPFSSPRIDLELAEGWVASGGEPGAPAWARCWSTSRRSPKLRLPRPSWFKTPTSDSRSVSE